MSEPVVCGVCGTSNKANADRCLSCGAKLVRFTIERSDEDLHARRHQQDAFTTRWVAISFVMFLVLAALGFALLPMLVPAYDPQGFPGIAIAIVLWFAGGAATNFMSSDKTFVEPAFGGGLAVVPTMMYLFSAADVYRLSLVAYVLAAAMCVMAALMGSLLGHVLRRRIDPQYSLPPERRSRATSLPAGVSIRALAASKKPGAPESR